MLQIPTGRSPLFKVEAGNKYWALGCPRHEKPERGMDSFVMRLLVRFYFVRQGRPHAAARMETNLDTIGCLRERNFW